MEDDKLVRLEHFFAVDMKIKKEMNSLCPPNEYLGEDATIEYLDDAFDSMKYIFTELKCVANDYLGTDLIERIKLLEKKTMTAFAECGTNIEKLKLAYKTFISDMSLDFINLVKDECVGYTFPYPSESIRCTRTVNEMLHLIHSYIVNNDSILQAIPALEEKKNDFNYPITLRGNDSDYFHKLFEDFPANMDCGWTDMVVISDKKLIMMVRDRGHALTIEITLDKEVARVEYFIPKLCNVDMINALPGVNPVNKDSVGATGVIEVDKNALASSLFGFISKVPMDSDIISSYSEPSEIVVVSSMQK